MAELIDCHDVLEMRRFRRYEDTIERFVSWGLLGWLVPYGSVDIEMDDYCGVNIIGILDDTKRPGKRVLDAFKDLVAEALLNS